MNIETIQLTNINPAEYNPRIITKDEFEGLKTSLQTFGQQENLIVNKDMTLISGHQRLQAMLALGWTDAVCNVVDLDKHEEKKLNVLMNSQAISGQWDDLKLAEILEELKLDDNYESLRLNALEPLDLSPTEVEEDEPPEVSQEPPVSKLGEIYQLGRHRVMCGDSTNQTDIKLLMGDVKADMVFTDPPYGMLLDTDYSGMHKSSDFGKGGKTYDKVIGDHDDFTPELITSIFDNFDYCKEVFLWGADYYRWLIPKGGGWLVWDKRGGDTGMNLDKLLGSSFELCWTLKSHKRDIARVLWSGHHGMQKSDQKSRTHPTEKPTELARWFFERWGKETKIVADVYLGSGSTLIACEQTDRTCYGMELDPKYVDVIRKRYAKFIGKENDWQEVTPKVN